MEQDAAQGAQVPDPVAGNAGLFADRAGGTVSGQQVLRVEFMGAAAGTVCDVHVTGPAPIEYGGPVTRGARLTSDAQGRAVVAAPAAGQTVEIIGRALVSGVLGDFGKVNLARSTYTRPA